MRNWNKNSRSPKSAQKQLQTEDTAGTVSRREALGGRMRNWNKKQQEPEKRAETVTDGGYGWNCF